jgi:Flp pilus assembly protein TadD
MTGLVPRRHGARDNALYPLSEEVPVLAEHFASAGYDTAAFVSSVVLDRRAGLARGFRIYDDAVRVGRREAFNYEERAASQTNAAVVERLAGLEEPFFLWVHYFDPHLPYVPPPPYDSRFAGRPYDGEIAFMDAAIGRLLERLPGSLVVVAGDHGESLGEHGEASHGVFLYQSTQRVPLIVAGPGVPGGLVVEQRVGLVDVLPTLLELAKVGRPGDGDGRSLVPLLENKKKKWRDSGYEMETLFPSLAYDWAPLRGFVRGDLVTIDAPRPEVYDLATDPGQQKNLGTGRPGARRMLEALRRQAAPPGEANADAERRMELAALGYASGASGDASLDPKDGIALLRILEDARTSIQRGRAPDAIEPLNALLEKNPGNLQARLALVSAQLGAGRAAAAVSTAREALARHPGDDLVHFTLANALAAESRAEAREHYEQTLRLNPRRTDAYLNYASLLVAGGEQQAARELLARAQAAEVEDPDIYTERAVLELMRGDKDAAIVLFEQALRLNPYADDVTEALRRLRATPGDRR